MEPLYDCCFRTDAVADGQAVPAGGNLTFGGQKLDMHVIADTQSLGFLYDAADAVFAGLKHDAIPALLAQYDIPLSADMYGRLHAFQAALADGAFTAADTDAQNRRVQKYTNGLPLLSGFFTVRCAMCLEISLATHAYLKRNGHDATLVSGNAHWQDGDGYTEFNEPHVYLVLPYGRCHTVYDPTNPSIATAGKPYPSLYPVAPDLYATWDARAGAQRSLMPLTNALTRKPALFGVSSPDLSYSAKDVVRVADKPASRQPAHVLTF